MSKTAREIIEQTYVPAWDQHIGKDGADSILSALREEGFAVVPREPGERMLAAAIDAIHSDRRRGRRTVGDTIMIEYRAMIAAAAVHLNDETR